MTFRVGIIYMNSKEKYAIIFEGFMTFKVGIIYKNSKTKHTMKRKLSWQEKRSRHV